MKPNTIIITAAVTVLPLQNHLAGQRCGLFRNLRLTAWLNILVEHIYLRTVPVMSDKQISQW
jgi:hypothetical protein